MTIDKRLYFPAIEDLSVPEYLARVRTDHRGNPAINSTTYERAVELTSILSCDMPMPIVRALAEGSVMFYWNKTNIPGFDHYDRLELFVEISPSGRISYSWNATPATGNYRGEFGCGTGSIQPESPVAKLFETSVVRAIKCFAPGLELQ